MVDEIEDPLAQPLLATWPRLAVIEALLRLLFGDVRLQALY